MHIRVDGVIVQLTFCTGACTSNLQSDFFDRQQDQHVKGQPSLFAILARMDRHSGTVADKIYAALSSKKQSKLSAYAFRRIMGEPVEFPTHADWRREGQSMNEIMKRAESTLPDERDLTELEEYFGDQLDIEDDWMQILEVMKEEATVKDDPSFSTEVKACETVAKSAYDDAAHAAPREGDDFEDVSETNNEEHDAEKAKPEAKAPKISKKSAKKQRRKDKKEKKDQNKKARKHPRVLRFQSDDETSSNDKVVEEIPKRSKVVPASVASSSKEMLAASVASSSKEAPQQRKAPSAKAAPVKFERLTYASSTDVKRFFLSRQYVKQGLSQVDKDAIRRNDIKARGCHFTEEEKMYLVEEMREMQLAGYDATTLHQVKQLIQKGRDSKFLIATLETQTTYAGQVQRYIKTINAFSPFEDAKAEYMSMRDKAETSSV